MASKPTVAAIAGDAWYGGNAMTWLAPATPASPPASAIARVIRVATPMPAYAPADGLSPTARNSNPSDDRNRSHCTRNTAPSAMRNPTVTR